MALDAKLASLMFFQEVPTWGCQSSTHGEFVAIFDYRLPVVFEVDKPCFARLHPI